MHSSHQEDACTDGAIDMQLTAHHLRSQCLAGKVLPIEVLPLGEFDPVYRSTLDVQNGELPVLPLSIYGAVRPRHHWQLLIAVLAQSRGAERWSEGLGHASAAAACPASHL